MYIAIVITIIQTAAPVEAVMICLNSGKSRPPKAVNMAVSSERIDTRAEVRLITFADDITGLFKCLYLTTSTMDFMTAVKV